MSHDQSSYPEWQWDGSLTEDEIRERIGLEQLDVLTERSSTSQCDDLDISTPPGKSAD